MRALGAVPAGTQRVELTVQGTEAATVVLRDLRVRVTASGGGPVRTTVFDVDLDAPAPEPAAVAGQEDLPLRVDDEGEPFRTSAVGGQTEWGCLIGGTEWIDNDTGGPAR